MKRIILLISLFSTVGFSQSSQSPGVNLENDFSKANLEDKHVMAFEYRAKQKVVDFCDYIQLISNKDYDKKLREHSKKTAMALFNSEECTVTDSLVSGNHEALTIGSYLDQLLNTHYHKIVGEARDIVLLEGLSLTEEGSYLGTISYTHELKCYDQNNQLVHTSKEQKRVGVTLSRKTKAFGDTEKVIWVVNLCDIQNES